MDMKKVVSEVRWVPDKDRNACPYCQNTFSLFFRRHHCRICGEVVCHKCSDTNSGKRICSECRQGTSMMVRRRSQLGLNLGGSQTLDVPRSLSEMGSNDYSLATIASGRSKSTTTPQIPK